MTDANELLDVVDEHDMVIGRQTRAAVHAQRLRHRAVHIFVFRSDGRMLLHRRSPGKEEFPDVWTSSASGHVSAGETYDAAAPRELQEELGITAALQRCGTFPAGPETSWEFTTLYCARSDEELTVDTSEIAAVRWMEPAEIRGWLARSPEQFSPAFRLLFAWYLTSAGR